MTQRYSFPKDRIKIVLFEKIHNAAAETFEAAGYKVNRVADSATGEELIKPISDAHIIGVRSRSKVDEAALAQAKRLLAVGCFTVGTDQVELDAARAAAVPVWNAPHSSTRSVAELTVCCILGLARNLSDKIINMREGRWEKSAVGSKEVRNKTLGIIGYGHIGQQVGLLAEALGMNVLFYDIVKKLPLGRATAVESMDELLASSEYVTLHIPAGEENINLINKEAIAKMKPGSFLLNHARGKVVDVTALHEAMSTGHIAGAALDVFPEEPESNSAEFVSPLSALSNVILTPHVGGSTLEAQHNIGCEVATSLIRYLELGDTEGAVNFPNVSLPTFPGAHRILNIHRNEPGALAEINQIFSEVGANIEAQYLNTYRDIGYLIVDIGKEVAGDVKSKIAELPRSIRTRILF